MLSRNARDTRRLTRRSFRLQGSQESRGAAILITMSRNLMPA